jgi:hypothetical protein
MGIPANTSVCLVVYHRGLTPEITGISDHMLTDENGDTSFVIETTL